MTDAVLATVFILMLLLPCAAALLSDHQREEELEAARAEKRSRERPVTRQPARRQVVARQAVARHIVLEQKIVEPEVLLVQPAEAIKPVQAPAAPIVPEVNVAPAVPAAEVPAAVVFRPVVRNPERALTDSISPFEPLGIARRLPGTEFGRSLVQRRAERTQVDDLMARVEAARAEAAALLAVARAAAEKAYAAAQRAAQAEFEMQEAAEAAAMVRARYSRTHSLEGPSTPIPASHPSLDFPRSRGPRRAA